MGRGKGRKVSFPSSGEREDSGIWKGRIEENNHCEAPAAAAAAAAKSLQSCPTLCDPIDSSPPGSPVPGILLARTLEWVWFARHKYIPNRSEVSGAGGR